jgi:hypothetical protein
MSENGDPGWRKGGLQDAEAVAALADELPASSLWSLLLTVMERRAKARSLADLLRQWEQDDFTAPAPIDQRTLMRVDARLLEAAAAFEAIELSPLTPLGTCSAMALASQNKIVSALRGTEVLSDPTNTLALECARRLRQDPEAVLRLGTSQRVVRAQRLPPLHQRQGPARHFRQHFRMFVLCTAGREVKDHGFVVAALVEHIATHLRALELLQRDGFAFGARSLRLLATEDRTAIMDRIAAACPSDIPTTREVLNHPYYSGGLRFMLSVRAGDFEIPLIDGGSFDWVARLRANRKHVFVASGIGSQLVPAMFGVLRQAQDERSR